MGKPKTAAERMREYRARKKQLLQVGHWNSYRSNPGPSMANEPPVMYVPVSTSKSHFAEEDVDDSISQPSQPKRSLLKPAAGHIQGYVFVTQPPPLIALNRENKKLGTANQSHEERIGCVHQSGDICSAGAEDTHLFDEEQDPLHIVKESSLENPKLNVPQLERLCRLCLAELDALTNIFEFHDVHQFNIADAVSALLGMDMNPEDGYPEKICGSCLLEVVHFRRFKRKCFESKAKLKEMVDEKNYLSGNIKMESEDHLFEAVENEVTGIRVKCEAPGSETDENVLQAVENNGAVRDEEELREPSRVVGVTTPGTPFQLSLDADTIGRAAPQSPQKKNDIIYPQPCVAGNSVVNPQDHCTNVNSGQISDSVNQRKSEIISVPNSKSLVENQRMMTIQLEGMPDEELCNEQEVSSNEECLSRSSNSKMAS